MVLLLPKAAGSAAVASIQSPALRKKDGSCPVHPAPLPKHHSGLASTTAPAKVTHVLLQLLKELFHMQEVGVPQNPGQKLP